MRSINIVKKSAAFTLAEILITLLIIGVIAVLTVPLLKVKIDKEITVTTLKKSYSEFYQAAKKSEAEYGPITDWDFSLNSDAFFQKYIKGQIGIAVTETVQEAKRKHNLNYKNLNGTSAKNYSTFYNDSVVVTTRSGYQYYLKEQETSFLTVPVHKIISVRNAVEGSGVLQLLCSMVGEFYPTIPGRFKPLNIFLLDIPAFVRM